MREVYTIICAKRYDFTNKENGERLRGVTLYYLGAKETTKELVGMPVLKSSAPIEFWDDLDEVPGKYQLDFTCRAGADGKPVLKLVEIAYHGSVKSEAKIDD